MKFLKYGLGISALLVIALIVAWKQAEPAPLPEHSESAALLAPGAWQTQMREFDLVDTTRPTDANGDFAGAPERRLHTRVWFPVSDAGGTLPAQAMPLIVTVSPPIVAVRVDALGKVSVVMMARAASAQPSSPSTLLRPGSAAVSLSSAST